MVLTLYSPSRGPMDAENGCGHSPWEGESDEGGKGVGGGLRTEGMSCDGGDGREGRQKGGSGGEKGGR